eukprot:jgi/Mesen1/7612/ME000397S06676
MTKFQKLLEGQSVPEWRQAYCNYKRLKKELKVLRRAIDQTQHSVPIGVPTGNIGPPAAGLFSNLLGRSARRTRGLSSYVKVERVSRGAGVNEYHTEVLPAVLKGDPAVVQAEVNFFAYLDRQLNKVEAFYAAKETELMERAHQLHTQVEVLLALRAAVAQNGTWRQNDDNKDGNDDSGRGGHYNADDDSPGVSPTSPRSANSRDKDMATAAEAAEAASNASTDAITEASASRDTLSPLHAASPDLLSDVPAPSTSPVQHKPGSHLVALRARRNNSSSRHLAAMGSPSILQQVKMDLPATTPRATLRKLYHTLLEDLGRGPAPTSAGPSARAPPSGSLSSGALEPQGSFLSSTMAPRAREVRQADKMVRTALVELYHGLSFLHSYSALNTTAFAKILKKHDKVTGWSVLHHYVGEGGTVDLAHFTCSDKVAKTMSGLEALFTEHFAERSRPSAMRALRPNHQSASHTVSFFTGLFVGVSIALVLTIGALLYIKRASSGTYMSSVLPVFSGLALVLLHVYLYAANVWLWRYKLINYAFIFEFSPGTELRHRQLLLLSTGLTAVLLGGMALHLALPSPSPSGLLQLQHVPRSAKEVIPLVTFCVFVAVLLLPLNLVYRSSRMFLLRCIKHSLLAPLYKVTLADFFFADQMCSQVQMLRFLEYTVCFYAGGFFLTRNSKPCGSSSTSFTVVYYLLAGAPYWCRLMQCARRWVDEGERAHVYNGLKYLSAMVAVALKVTYKNKRTETTLVFFVLASSVATLYQVYWDLVRDWGLLQRKSRNPWLRDALVLRHKWIYFASMVLNVALRFAWLQTITRLHFGQANDVVVDVTYAALEVFRRALWNFYRLENEHLNNVGRFRAVKTVPLPFKDLHDAELDVLGTA